MKKLLSMLVMASMMVFALGTMGASAAAKAPKNDKAVVVVSFGSTFDDTRTKDIGGIEEAVAKAFPNRDFKRAVDGQGELPGRHEGYGEYARHGRGRPLPSESSDAGRPRVSGHAA